MSTLSKEQYSHGDYGDICEEVLEALSDWIDTEANEMTSGVAQHLHQHIRNHLAQSQYHEFSKEVSVPRYATGCDIEIGEKIGIAILFHIPNESTDAIHQRIRTLFRSYDYLIFYGHQIPQESTDAWRQIKHSAKLHSTSDHELHALGNIQLIEYRIPFTEKHLSKESAAQLFVMLMVGFFIIAGSVFFHYTQAAGGVGGAYTGAIILFNLVVISMIAFLLTQM